MAGVYLTPTAGTGNSILGNAIYSNGGLGIDLNQDGVTLNDLLDPDGGPNSRLNFPRILAVHASAGTLTVHFSLDVPAGSYRIEFFKNPSGTDPSGYGEGEVFAASTNVAHPGGGAAFFINTFPGSLGDRITATATACTAPCTVSFGSTSEFAQALNATTAVSSCRSRPRVERGGGARLGDGVRSCTNLGFHLYRANAEAGPWTRLNSSLIPGLGSSAVGRAYSYRDTGLSAGTRYYYRLEDVDASGRITSHGPISAVASSASPADGGTGRERAATRRRAGASCPDWVIAAYGATADPDTVGAQPRCTRHGDPDAVALDVVSRDARSATLELRTGGFYALHEPAGSVRVFVQGFDFSQHAEAAALPLRRALIDAVVGRRVQLADASALELERYPGLVLAALGESEMRMGPGGTLRAVRHGAHGTRMEHATARGSGTSCACCRASSRARRRAQSSRSRPSGSMPGAEIVLARRVRFQLLFTGREAGESGRGSQGRARGTRPAPVAPEGERLALLYTTSRALYGASFEQLFPARAASVAVSELRLERQGVPVAFHVEPRTASFGPGSVLFFYADQPAASTDFSAEVAYELLRAPGGLQMPLVSGAPTPAVVSMASARTADFEIDRNYLPALLDAPDLWLWDGFVSGTTLSEAFSLSGVDTAAAGSAAARGSPAGSLRVRQSRGSPHRRLRERNRGRRG